MKELAKRLAANEATTPAIGISATCGEDEFAWDAARRARDTREEGEIRDPDIVSSSQNIIKGSGRESRHVVFTNVNVLSTWEKSDD